MIRKHIPAGIIFKGTFMNRFWISIGLAALAVVAFCPRVQAEERIVTLGGSVTEIVCALGAENKLVGADQSSTYPASILKLSRLSYHRNTSSEAVLSLNPTLVLLTDQASP